MLKLNLYIEPRQFTLKGYNLKDHGKIEVSIDQAKTNEFFTLKTESGKECDITATSWGFYLGPSLNNRLVKEGFKVALVSNDTNQIYVMAVENEKIDLFWQYVSDSNARVITWLDQWLIDGQTNMKN